MMVFITKYLLLCISLVVVLGIGCSARKTLSGRSRLADIKSWVCTYSSTVDVADISRYDLAVLDSDSHPDLTAIKASGTLALGYVSLGEVGDYRWYWPQIAGKSWVLDKNPNWNSAMLDVREPAWTKLLLDEIIPAILNQGFDGLFFDTVDTAEYLELYHTPKRYPGSQAAMIALIHQIRARFPELYIIVNRGFSLLDEIAASVDGVLAESVFSQVDWGKKETRLLQPAVYTDTFAKLRRLQQESGLQIFTLDYLAEMPGEVIQKIVRRSRDYGFLPYISTPALDRVRHFTLDSNIGKRGQDAN